MEIKDLLGALNINATTIEEFTASFNERFVDKKEAVKDQSIRSEIESAVTGKIANQLQRSVAKTFGINQDEIKDKKWEDVVSLAGEKYSTIHNEFESFKTKGGDDKVKEYESKIEKLKHEKDEYKSLLTDTQKSLEQTQQEWNSKYKGLLVNNSLSKVKEEVAPMLKSDLSIVERKGFEAELNDNYVFDYDEESNALMVLDKQGNKVKHPTKVGSYLTPAEAFDLTAEKLGLKKKNNNGGKPFGTNQTSQSLPQKGKVHPSIEKALRESGY